MNFRLTVYTYLKVGYLLHIITVFEILFLALLFNAEFFNTWLNAMHVFPKTAIILCLLSFPFFPQLDVRSRFQNYKMARDQFYLYGFQPKIIKPFAHSRCQRDAIRVAASHFGYVQLCNNYFYNQGHRWYHVLPDFVFKTPTYLLNKKFWQTTFFARHYACRIKYEMICVRQMELQLTETHQPKIKIYAEEKICVE